MKTLIGNKEKQADFLAASTYEFMENFKQLTPPEQLGVISLLGLNYAGKPFPKDGQQLALDIAASYMAASRSLRRSINKVVAAAIKEK